MSDLRVEVDPVILSCAVRYALDRRSYLPGLVADEVRRCWPHLAGQQDVIRDDLVRWLGDVSGSDDLTEATWRDLFRWIERELAVSRG